MRQKFLAHAGLTHLEPEEKQALRRLVEEELLKMQVWVQTWTSGDGVCCPGVDGQDITLELFASWCTQVDEAGTRQEKLDLTKKVKRAPTLCNDQERKRFRFNSESG